MIEAREALASALCLVAFSCAHEHGNAKILLCGRNHYFTADDVEPGRLVGIKGGNAFEIVAVGKNANRSVGLLDGPGECQRSFSPWTHVPREFPTNVMSKSGVINQLEDVQVGGEGPQLKKAFILRVLPKEDFCSLVLFINADADPVEEHVALNILRHVEYHSGYRGFCEVMEPLCEPPPRGPGADPAVYPAHCE